ncbi:hypothetical protein [Actinomadura sp. WAC 06369]|uniref:hypothetical protein n=1 Tax=Actinomadura sp. WAC 06369 TaxID=2203193 RepID=UPI000F78A720|nr:hypothetical protein [Actinomadura sp. WAC 06369]RSN61913.1 hypothetical protein DMH08_20175 [Actinomadura sp. WAC 06369]
MGNDITANAVQATDVAATGTAAAPADATAPATPAGVTGDVATVWNAAATTPGGTIPALATATSLTRAVVKNALTELETGGHVTRTPGAKGANTDTWTAVQVPVSDDSTSGDAAPAGVPAATIADAMRIMQEEADRRAAAEAELQTAIAEEEARRAQAVADLARRQTAEATRRALADLITAATTAYAAIAAGDDITIAGLEPVYDATAEVRRATRATGRATSSGGGNGGRRNGEHRAAPRPLRPEVAAHLTAHPDSDFTPGEIARVLGRSSGAVANALATMAEKGEAVMTSEKPVRYRAAGSA